MKTVNWTQIGHKCPVNKNKINIKCKWVINMKKIFILCILIFSFLFLALFIYDQTKYSQFSKETREWMLWYDTLNSDEKKCISYIPNELSEAMENGFNVNQREFSHFLKW